MASSFSGPTAWAYVSLDAHLDGVAQILKSLDLPFSLLQQIRQRRAVDPPEADDLFRCPNHILHPSTRADAGGQDGSLELRSDLLRLYLIGETSTAHDEGSSPTPGPEDGFRIVLAERVVHSEDVADLAAEDDTGGDNGGKTEGRESLLGLRSLFKKTRGANVAAPVRMAPKVGTERPASSSCRGCFPDRSRGAARPAARGNTAVGEGKTDDDSRLREGSHASASTSPQRASRLRYKHPEPAAEKKQHSDHDDAAAAAAPRENYELDAAIPTPAPVPTSLRPPTAGLLTAWGLHISAASHHHNVLGEDPPLVRCSSRDSRLLLAGLQEEVESLTLKCRRYLRDADLVEIWCAKRGDKLLWLATLRLLLEHALTTVRDAVSIPPRTSRGSSMHDQISASALTLAGFAVLELYRVSRTVDDGEALYGLRNTQEFVLRFFEQCFFDRCPPHADFVGAWRAGSMGGPFMRRFGARVDAVNAVLESGLVVLRPGVSGEGAPRKRERLQLETAICSAEGKILRAWGDKSNAISDGEDEVENARTTSAPAIDFTDATASGEFARFKQMLRASLLLRRSVVICTDSAPPPMVVSAVDLLRQWLEKTEEEAKGWENAFPWKEVPPAEPAPKKWFWDGLF